MERFSKVSEADVTRAIAREWSRDFEEFISSDVIIVGGGPSGLAAAIELGKARVKTLIVESHNFLGGGFWIGGYAMNKVTFRAPAEKVLDELNIRYKEIQGGLFIADGPESCSKLIAAACDAGAKILNMTKVDDVIYRNGRVEGVVINWSSVSYLPKALTCVDPVSLESKAVVDATGHDAAVVRALEARGLVKIKGCGFMDVPGSEDALVEKTGELVPGLYVAGMAVSSVFGIPRMGPTFGGMLLSGKKVAESIKAALLLNGIKV